jgi:hypothetical protein
MLLTIVDFNLHPSTGVEILSAILKSFDRSLDLEKILPPVTNLSLARVFLTHEGQKFEFDTVRQTSWHS